MILTIRRHSRSTSRSGSRAFARITTRAISAVAALAMVVTVQNASSTLASWSDSEWVSSAPEAIGTVDCTAPTSAFASRGEGRVLSGSLLGLDLANVADVASVLVTNDATRSMPRPATANPVPGQSDAYADVLRLDLLYGLLSVDATNVLQLPLNTDTGLLGQYGRAQSTGDSWGAGGYVTESGNINTSGSQAGYPNLATLKLSTLLNSLGVNLGDLVGGVADAELTVGAVAGRAALENACDAMWNGSVATNVKREYLAAGITLGITSPAVSAVGTAVDTTLLDLESTIGGLVGKPGLLSGVVSTVVNLVKGVVNTLSLVTGLRVAPTGSTGQITAITLDLSTVRALVDNPVEDPGGVLSVSLRSGTVTIDTAALLEATYPGQYSNGLNGLDPNTNPLADPLVLDTLKSRLLTVLQTRVTSIDTTLRAALDDATITAVISLPFEKCATLLCLTGNWQPAGALSITATGSLSQLLAGTATIDVQADALLQSTVGGLLNGLISGVVSALTGVLGPAVGGIVDTALRPIVTSLLPTLNTLTTPAVNLVANVYDQLFLEGLVAVTINAQNDPRAGDAEPHDWASLPDGRYDVSAVRIGVLDALNPNAVWLYLGRGSIGTTCSPAAAPLACAGY